MGFKDMNTKSVVLFSGTTPAAATGANGTVLATLVGINQYAVALILADLIGATGGTLDVYIQTSFDAKQDDTGRWIDIAHYTQLAGGGAAASWTSSHTRGFGTATAPGAANPTSVPPILPANQIRPDLLGNALRILVVAGAGTSVGAAIKIEAMLSQ